MELREQAPPPTPAQKLGDVTHVSPLLRKVMQLSGGSPERVAALGFPNTSPDYEATHDVDGIIPTRGR